MRLNFSVPVIALLAGAALGFCLRPTTSATTEPEDSTKEHTPTHIADATSDATIETLRNRIRELEALLAEAAGNAADKGEPVAENGDGPRPERRGPFNPREMMERLKTEDPQRYAQITNQIARFRRHRTEQAISKLEYFASVDLSAMGEEALETHSRLQSMIAKREEIEERIHDESISDEERESSMQEMFQMERDLHDLYHAERENLFAETVRELGFAGEDADDIVSTLNEIIKMTQTNFGPPRGPGGPGGPGGRRGRR